MTNAPDTLRAARALLLDTIPGLDPLAVGIVGDDQHNRSGSSYHLGRSALRPTSYTITESPRDRAGLSEDASALDIGHWSVRVGGTTHTLRTFSTWLVAQCRAEAPDTRDIREVIYSPDGRTVRRWDRLGRRATGDDSHLSHTHISYFRDSTRRDKAGLFRRYLTDIGLLEDDMPTADEIAAAVERRIFGHKITDAADTAKPQRQLSLETWVAYTDNRRNSILAGVAGVKATVDAILRNVVADDGDRAAIQAQIEQSTTALTAAITATPPAVVDALADVDRSPEDTAAALRAVLGDRAAEVGRLLAAA